MQVCNVSRMLIILLPCKADLFFLSRSELASPGAFPGFGPAYGHVSILEIKPDQDKFHIPDCHKKLAHHLLN